MELCLRFNKTAVLAFATLLVGSTCRSILHQQQGGCDNTKLLGPAFHCDQISFLKSSKTASTAVGATLYRVGVVHGKRFYGGTGQSHLLKPRSILQKDVKPFDFVINHSATSFKATMPFYTQNSKAARKPGLLTIVREPVSRYVSEFYFVAGARGHNKSSILNSKVNHMSEQMGYGNDVALDAFLASQDFRDIVFFISEKLDQGLAALHLDCGWPIKELLSGPSNCANCGRVMRRWDGRIVPKADPISEDTRAAILQMNLLDKKLYTAATAKWDEVAERGGQRLTDVEVEIKRQKKVLSDHCQEKVYKENQAPLWNDNPGCLWLSLGDYEYERTVNPEGYVDWETKVALLPEHSERSRPGMKTNISVASMIKSYDMMYEELIENPRHMENI